MKSSELSVYLQRLDQTSSRIEITKILAELFEKTSSDEIDKTIYLILGVLAPSFRGIVFNLADKMMLRVIAKAYDSDIEEVGNYYKKTGDIGDLVHELAKKKKKVKGNLTVEEVYKRLVEIAEDSGEKSQERKVEKTAQLLKDLDALSAKYIARIPVGKLRLGFSEKTIIAALSLESGMETTEIKKAYNIKPDIGYIAKLVRGRNLKEVKPEIGVPIVPMLPARLNSTVEMVKKMGEVSVEPKFDGLRIFIHFRKKDNFLRIFTRNMNAISNDTFPELTGVGKFIKANEVILDTEAVGIDREREMFLDFQKTIQRRRKHDIGKTSGNIPLQFQVFDLLLVDGKSLIHEPYIKRRKEVERVIVNGNILRIDENTITSDPEEIKKLHQKYLKMGLEGIIAKRSNGEYVSGRTGWNWVKMKEVEGKRGKLSDTIDCVIMGYSVGKGKRSGFGMGQFLVGVMDGDTIKTVTKVGTGITDIVFKELNTRLRKILVNEKPKEYQVHKILTPDYWVIPEVIVEIAADEITKSPTHTAGLALRFPRLIKFRDDKSPNEATTLKEVKKLFKLQKS